MKELVGKEIKIIRMIGETQYTNRVGKVTHIDDLGQLHGTWGGCAIIPGIDEFMVLEDNDNETKFRSKNG